MNNLATYISALKKNKSDLLIVEQQSKKDCYEEDGTIINSSEQTTRFSNGVVLKALTEMDSSDIPNDSVCTECWISYEIAHCPNEIDIQPHKKRFTNQCQEAFWLKMNAIQADL